MKLLKTYENESNNKKAEVYEGQTSWGADYYSVVGVNKDGVYGRNLYQGYSLARAIEQALWYIN